MKDSERDRPDRGLDREGGNEAEGFGDRFGADDAPWFECGADGFGDRPDAPWLECGAEGLDAEDGFGAEGGARGRALECGADVEWIWRVNRYLLFGVKVMIASSGSQLISSNVAVYS